MRTQKLRLEQLKVCSFVTTVSQPQSGHVKGGCPSVDFVCSIINGDCNNTECCDTKVEQSAECN